MAVWPAGLEPAIRPPQATPPPILVLTGLILLAPAAAVAQPKVAAPGHGDGLGLEGQAVRVPVRFPTAGEGRIRVRWVTDEGTSGWGAELAVTVLPAPAPAE